jgi:hypothetical protein
VEGSGVIRYFPDLVQGSEEWAAARMGVLTASEMKLIVTPSLKPAANDKERAHVYEILAQRITGYVEPQFVSDDMLRGTADEVDARILYAQHYAPVTDMGFITNDKWGFTIGYSPDGMVGDDGLLECKSRRAKYQVQTIIENIGQDCGETIPADYLMQCQTGLLVSERQWIDLVSFSGGLPMAVMRVYPHEKVQAAIIEAAAEFEKRVAEKMEIYQAAIVGLQPTERKVEMEMYLS